MMLLFTITQLETHENTAPEITEESWSEGNQAVTFKMWQFRNKSKTHGAFKSITWQ